MMPGSRYESTAVESQALVRIQYNGLLCTKGIEVAPYCNAFRNIYGGMVAVRLLESEDAVAQKMILQLQNNYPWILRIKNKPNS